MRIENNKEIKAVRIEKGMIISLSDLPNQIDYKKQSQIKLGDMLFIFQGSAKLIHQHYRIHKHGTDKIGNPVGVFIVNELKYKSRFHKFFKVFLKKPINWVKVEVIDLL